MDLEIEKNKQYYPLSNILFHVQIPFLQDQIMSRLFHFVVTDLAVHLNNDFAELIMGPYLMQCIVVCGVNTWTIDSVFP